LGKSRILDEPLGVAINTRGYLLVGNYGRDNDEIYDPSNGGLLGTFGKGQAVRTGQDLPDTGGVSWISLATGNQYAAH